MKHLAAVVFNRLRSISSVRMVGLGYLSYILFGFILLSLPALHTHFVKPLDNLFTVVSAVSTTGLTTVTVVDDYNFWGQLVILALIQLGGLGYMTFSSFIILSTKRVLDDKSKSVAHTVFSTPKDFKIEKFIVSVIIFTTIAEVLGAIGLYFIFSGAGTPAPLWSAVFHSVSAFCTAGFSLFPASFEGLRDNFWLNGLISVLSLIGAMGFIVCVDVWRKFKGDVPRVTLTTRVILSMTGWLLVLGTVLLFLTETYGGAVPPESRLMFSFFQAMTAFTTVGFNTVAIGTLSKSALMLIAILMVIGASPSGTGGGLKTTTFSAIWALMKSAASGSKDVKIYGAEVPDDRIRTAVATFTFYVSTLVIGTYLLSLTEAEPFLDVFFEAASALGTVGLSMGLTASLTALGKFLVIILMYVGRVGPLTFGMALYVKPELIFDDDKTDLAV